MWRRLQEPTALDQLFFDSECGLSISVIEHLVASQTDAFLVMQGDTVLFERYFNGQLASDPCFR